MGLVPLSLANCNVILLQIINEKETFEKVTSTKSMIRNLLLRSMIECLDEVSLE